MNEPALLNKIAVEGFSKLTPELGPEHSTELKRYWLRGDQGFIQIMAMLVDDQQGKQVVDFTTYTSHIPQRMVETKVGERK